MKNYIKMLSKSILIIFLFSACHKETQKTKSSEYFPNTVGNSWQYDVIDSIAVGSSPDTPNRYMVTVKIVGIKELVDGKNATIWQFQYPWGNDTNYVRVIEDTIEIFDLAYSRNINDLNYPRAVFLFPFNIEKRWDGKLFGVDSFRVVNQLDFNLGSQSYSGCYDIYNHYLGPNTEINDHYIFKPFVGMVSENFIHYINGPTTYRTWNIKTFSIN